MDTLKLNIVTPNGEIFNNDINSVTLPGSDGEFGVLPGHAALVSLLSAGVIEIEKTSGKKELVAVNWGYCNVSEAEVTVLADGAIAILGDSESEVANAISKAKELIKSISDSNIAIATVEAKLESAGRNLI
ncbi:MAG: F0F1 ATP synthase subunit epsilon [Campylobacterales bacterium]|nr:F0F1 ATP synthase subunit epsilon [Campylobacterales bacterium]